MEWLSTQLADVRTDAEHDLGSAVKTLRSQDVTATLAQMPVDRLRDVVSPVRIKALKTGGYQTIEDLLDIYPSQLEQLPGIGSSSAIAIAHAVREMHQHLQQAPLEVPPPDEIGNRHFDLLRAAYQRVRSRRISQSMLEQLRTTSDKLHHAVRTAKQCGQFWNRLVRRRETEPAVTAAVKQVSAISESEHTDSILTSAESIWASLTPPMQPEHLIADYEAHYADYFAAIEKVDEATSGPNALHRTAAQKGRHGAIPQDIADGVEAVTLSIDGLDVDLRGYQEFGAKYLVHQERTVLGDEMGLGKTIQAMAVMIHLQNTEEASRFLVICPASIIGNWAREIQRRTSLPIRTLHGEMRSSEALRWQAEGGVAVTSYATLRTLQGLDQQPIDLLVADEAHYAKNPAAQRSQQVERLADASRRVVLMTGTALENKPQEFVNLVRLCNGPLGARLDDETEAPTRSLLATKRFETLVAPVYLRRNQEDVLRELPECIETEEWVELSSSERAEYVEALEAHNLMAMRQAAIGRSTQSSKFQRLGELHSHYLNEGEKVVVFSYFLNALDLAGEVVSDHVRIDGSVSAKSRMDLIDSFNTGNGSSAMLCQITAGGIGINLQSASAVIILEPQFKPTTEWQAIKRVHRMGQSRRVVVHRLFARGTVDESLRELVGAKTAIFNDYARESAVKNASPAAIETGEPALANRLLEMELQRRDQAKAS